MEFLQNFVKRKEINEDGEQKDITLAPIDFRDFEFRVNYKSENKLSLERGEIKLSYYLMIGLIKKTFRLIKRYSFTSGRTQYPFRIDCSIVKTSKKRKYYIPEYTVEQRSI